MSGRHVRCWILALTALLAGCASAPSRFYTLSSTATADGGAAVPVAVLVGPVTVPADVDRPEVVVAVTPNRVDLDEFNRWAAPLGDAIARVVAGDLTVLLATPDVATAPMANFRATYRVTINVQRFASAPGRSAQLDAVWTVQRIADGTTRSGRTTADETPTDDTYDALAAAHSRALARLSGDIAIAIRAEAG